MKKLFTHAWQLGTVALLCASMVVMTACTVDQVLSSIDAALQTAQGLSAAVGSVSPQDAAMLNLLTGVGITGIQAIQTAYDTYEKNKTTSKLQDVLAAAQAIQANLPQELNALHITDAGAVQKATAWVNLIVSIAQGIVTELSALQPAAGQRVSTAFTLTPELIQARWQSEVCGGNTSCGSLVKVHHRHLHKL